jgi:hypothetical protein
MRNLHTDSPFRLAILALQDSDGYVDALLGLARDQIVARRPAISRRLFAGAFSTKRSGSGPETSMSDRDFRD